MLENKVKFILQNTTDMNLSINVSNMQIYLEEIENKIEHFNSLEEDEKEVHYDEFRELYVEQKLISNDIDIIYNSLKSSKKV